MSAPVGQPLAGRRIAVTRAREQASELAAKLGAAGAEVLALPLIDVVKDVDTATLADVFAEFGAYDWIVFTSANGVRCFFEEFHRRFEDIRTLGLVRFTCLGDATAKAISDRHLHVECRPAIATSDALADKLVATGSLDSAKVLVVTGNLNRDTLIKRLEEARAIVDRLTVYRTEKADLTGDSAVADFRARGADAILFASSSAVQSFVDQASALQLDQEAVRPLAGSIGPQTSATMKKAGMPVDFEAKTPGLDALVDALIGRLGQ
jgi:uroporphyrinogen-III synthase